MAHERWESEEQTVSSGGMSAQKGPEGQPSRESTGKESWIVVQPFLPMNRRRQINIRLLGGYYGPGSMLNTFHR